MNTKRYLSEWIHLLFCMVLCIGCFSVSAYARTAPDIEKTSSLTLRYPCENVRFQAFLVADISGYGQYSLTDDFKKYLILPDSSTQEDWHKLAYTFSGYVMRDNLEPVQYSETNANGELVFSDMKAGLYLILGETCVNEGVRYTPTPFLAALPALDQSGDWLFEATAMPKYTKDMIPTPDQPEKETLRRKVIKVWKNDDAAYRPDYIDIQLLRDGRIWDTVRLTAEHSWSYEWQELDAGYTWQIVEKQIPEGYFVTIELDEDLYVVTNSANTPDFPSPDSPNIPDIPHLPQTGVLRWPVGILAAVGTVLFILGIRKRKGKHE